MRYGARSSSGRPWLLDHEVALGVRTGEAGTKCGAAAVLGLGIPRRREIKLGNGLCLSDWRHCRFEWPGFDEIGNRIGYLASVTPAKNHAPAELRTGALPRIEDPTR